MNPREYLEYSMNPVGSTIWVCSYSFKSGSNYMYSHIKPTPAVILNVGRMFGSFRVQFISEKTMQPTTKTADAYRFWGVSETKEGCVELYKEKVGAHIQDFRDHIAEFEAKIEKLESVLEEI